MTARKFLLKTASFAFHDDVVPLLRFHENIVPSKHTKKVAPEPVTISFTESVVLRRQFIAICCHHGEQRRVAIAMARQLA